MHSECKKCCRGIVWFTGTKICDKKPNKTGSFIRPDSDKGKCEFFKEELKQ